MEMWVQMRKEAMKMKANMHVQMQMQRHQLIHEHMAHASHRRFTSAGPANGFEEGRSPPGAHAASATIFGKPMQQAHRVIREVSTLRGNLVGPRISGRW